MNQVVRQARRSINLLIERVGKIMVKFSKQLDLQLVPEWKQAFCDYKKLKQALKLLKVNLEKGEEREGGESEGATAEGIHSSDQDLIHHHHNHHKEGDRDQKQEEDDDGRQHRGGGGIFMLRRRGHNRRPIHAQENVIKVHNKKCSSHGQMEIYETEVLEPLCANPREVSFFQCLDEELNKVNGFYASREDEYSMKLDALKRQLTRLVGMRKTLEDQQASSSNLYATSPSICFIPYKSPSSTPTKSLLKSEIVENEMHLKAMEAQYETMGCHVINHIESYGGEEKEADIDQIHNVDHMNTISTSGSVEAKLNVVKSPIVAITHLLWDNMSSNFQTKRCHEEISIITRKKFKYARKKLRVAFVEYYRALGLLKSFSSLNMLAFGKILKKYDKVTGRNASTPYLQALERSRLNNSNKVDCLMEEVEKLFVHYFAKDDKRKAMMLLRPAQKKACHTTTYFVGLFSGWSLAFFASFIILLHFNGVKSSDPKLQNYAKEVYPLYSVLLLVLLHMFMYGWNVYLWCQKRINYPFIFEFGPRTELRSREILLVCTCLTTIVVASMVCHLIFYFHDMALFNTNSIPLSTFLVFVLLLFCPLNVFHRSSRFFFLRCMKRIFLAPFYKVTMADFFLADQLTSQVATIRQLQYIFCYYLGGQLIFEDTLRTCGGTKSHQYAYILSFLPFWWRLMQCLRRWNDEGDSVHLANGGKYLSAMVAIGCRLSFQFYRSKMWLCIFIMTSSIATIYQIYWDIIKDWGLLQRHSKNPWLRDQLLLKKKSIYFLSIVLNCILRLAWIQSLTHFQHDNSNDHYIVEFLFASLEVFRRGHWNIYRLENEHLNNVGKYRATKTVPLPFRDEFVTSI